jgi:hypothetical protein
MMIRVLPIVLLLAASCAPDTPVEPRQEFASIRVLCSEHGQADEIPLEAAKIIHCDTARLGLPDLSEGGSDLLPPGLREGDGLLLTIMFLYHDPDSSMTDLEQWFYIHVLLPARVDGEGRAPRVMVRHRSVWTRPPYVEVADTNGVRYRVGQNGTRATIRFDPPLTIDLGEEGRARVSGELTVEDPHPSYALYLAMRLRSADTYEQILESLWNTVGNAALLEMAANPRTFREYRGMAIGALAQEGDARTGRALAALLARARGRCFDDLAGALENVYEQSETPETLMALISECGRCRVENATRLLEVLRRLGARGEALIALIDSRDPAKVGMACVDILVHGVPMEHLDALHRALWSIPRGSVSPPNLMPATHQAIQSATWGEKADGD